MESLRGYVLENFKADVWKTSWGAVLVYTDYENAEYFRNHGLKDPEEWSTIPVKIVKEDPER